MAGSLILVAGWKPVWKSEQGCSNHSVLSLPVCEVGRTMTLTVQNEGEGGCGAEEEMK